MPACTPLGWKSSSSVSSAPGRSVPAAPHPARKSAKDEISTKAYGRTAGSRYRRCMPSLVLGPLLRHAGERDATIWVQTDEPCEVEVLGHTAPTFCVAGYHFGLVVVRDLEPGAVAPYEVALDGERVWPFLEHWPASVIRTPTRDTPVDIVFGSCRTAYPHEEPYTKKKDDDPQ